MLNFSNLNPYHAHQTVRKLFPALYEVCNDITVKDGKIVCGLNRDIPCIGNPKLKISTITVGENPMKMIPVGIILDFDCYGEANASEEDSKQKTEFINKVWKYAHYSVK